jgi:hypothetical protein
MVISESTRTTQVTRLASDKKILAVAADQMNEGRDVLATFKIDYTTNACKPYQVSSVKEHPPSAIFD